MPVSSKSLPSSAAARENESASLKKYRCVHTLMGATATADSQWSCVTRQGLAGRPREPPPLVGTRTPPGFSDRGPLVGSAGCGSLWERKAQQRRERRGLRGLMLEAASAQRSGSRSMFMGWGGEWCPAPSLHLHSKLGRGRRPQSEGLPDLRARAEAGWEGHHGKTHQIRAIGGPRRLPASPAPTLNFSSWTLHLHSAPGRGRDGR